MRKDIPLPFVFSGVVKKGRQLGRTLGYPTANLSFPNGLMPDIEHGVYAGQTSFDGERYASIMSFGRAETIKSKDVLLETHLLDYRGDLYGKELKVEISVFLRNMKKFASSLTFLFFTYSKGVMESPNLIICRLDIRGARLIPVSI